MTTQKNPHAVALGRLGGSAGKGASKARPSEQMRAAANARWSKTKGDAKDNPENVRKAKGNALTADMAKALAASQTVRLTRAVGDRVTVDEITVRPQAYIVDLDYIKFPDQP